MGIFDKLKEVAKAAVKTGEVVGTQVYRKARKPFRQYMAPERAAKVLEKQREIPRRAPLNVPKMDFPKGETCVDLLCNLAMCRFIVRLS